MSAEKKIGKVVHLPTKQRGLVTLTERTDKFTAQKLYEIRAWFKVMQQTNTVVPEVVLRWFTKNLSTINKILKVHESEAIEAANKQIADLYYPEENKGEPVYIQEGHPEIKIDEKSKKVLTLLVEVDGKEIPEKAKYKKLKDGTTSFVSIYTGQPIPKGYEFKLEIRDEPKRPEFFDYVDSVNDGLSKTVYDVETYELGAEHAKGLHFEQVWHDDRRTPIDPEFIEDVIYGYFIQQ